MRKEMGAFCTETPIATAPFSASGRMSDATIECFREANLSLARAHASSGVRDDLVHGGKVGILTPNSIDENQNGWSKAIDAIQDLAPIQNNKNKALK